MREGRWGGRASDHAGARDAKPLWLVRLQSNDREVETVSEGSTKAEAERAALTDIQKRHPHHHVKVLWSTRG